MQVSIQGGQAQEKRRVVLVADDDEGVRRMLCRSLNRAGYAVLTASDGDEAEKVARTARPDIALIDMIMPRKSGVEVLRDLAGEMPGMGIFMISGAGDRDDAQACLGLGAVDYLLKPFDIPAVAQAIGARLKLQGAA